MKKLKLSEELNLKQCAIKYHEGIKIIKNIYIRNE